MSGGFPQLDTLAAQSSQGINLVAFSEGGTAVQPSATPNTKGSWAQIVASTPNDASAILVKITWASSSQAWFGALVDIGIGGAGSEVVLIPNIDVGTPGQFFSGNLFVLLPLSIPAGTRIAARSQANVASVGSGDINVSLNLFDSSFGWEGCAGVDDLGTVAASSQGTLVATGNAAKGAYAQMIASTARDYVGFFVAVDCNGANDRCLAFFDVAVGGAGSEQIIAGDLPLYSTPGNGSLSPFIPFPIPAGSRVAVRGANTSAGAAENMGAIVYGVYQ